MTNGPETRGKLTARSHPTPCRPPLCRWTCNNDKGLGFWTNVSVWVFTKAVRAACTLHSSTVPHSMAPIRGIPSYIGAIHPPFLRTPFFPTLDFFFRFVLARVLARDGTRSSIPCDDGIKRIANGVETCLENPPVRALARIKERASGIETE